MTIYRAFERVGIEIEYAIVGRSDLDCLPIADVVLQKARAPRGLSWSNEFTAHVLELKTVEPAHCLASLLPSAQSAIAAMNRTLRGHGAQLMPSAMHPLLNPHDARPWVDDPYGIYAAYRRIFETRCHGFANLQSVHINLPFADDEEFARLHEAVRLVLPIIPALAASSPVVEGRLAGAKDYRLVSYRDNAREYPLVAGDIIPPRIATPAQYQAQILEPLYHSLADVDRDGVLRHPWLNSRGAIPRFDRNAIEIRLTDTQENVAADLAVAQAIVHLVKQLYDDERLLRTHIATETLVRILGDCMVKGEEAVVTAADYLDMLGTGLTPSAGEIWRRSLAGSEVAACAPLRAGTLATRLEKALGDYPSMQQICGVYQELCDCFARGALFRA